MVRAILSAPGEEWRLCNFGFLLMLLWTHVRVILDCCSRFIVHFHSIQNQTLSIEYLTRAGQPKVHLNNFSFPFKVGQELRLGSKMNDAGEHPNTDNSQPTPSHKSDLKCQQGSNLPIYKASNHIYVPHS